MKDVNGKEQSVITVFLQIFLPVMVYYLVNNGVVILGISGFQWWEAKDTVDSFSEVHRLYVQTGIKMLGMAFGAATVYPFYKRENLYESGKKISLRTCPLLMGAGAVISVGINFLFALTGFTNSSEQYQQVAETQFALPLWLAFLFYGILSPVAEELVFRGVLYRTLKRNTTVFVAVVGSSLMFGALHGNVVQMIYGSIMGVIMACIYQKHQNLWAPILFHGTANVAVYFLTYFF